MSGELEAAPANLANTEQWIPDASPPAFHGRLLCQAATRIREPAFVICDPSTGHLGVGFGGTRSLCGVRQTSQSGGSTPATGDRSSAPGGGYPVRGVLPPIYPEWLGDRAFTEAHALRFPYVAGEMANGIATTQLVVAMARAGMLGFFGAAGLGLPAVESALDTLQRELGASEPSPKGSPWGVNLIHSPAERGLEDALADLLLRRRVGRISASAFMELTPALVRCAATGLTRGPAGKVVRRHALFAKVSRLEVAELFMSPAPQTLLDGLRSAGKITAEEAALAREIPVADAVTAEADSGGHTDNRPLAVLLPAILGLRDTLTRRWPSVARVCVGAAGGLGTPAAVASAFALGAAYVVTGSVNQAAVESGLSAAGRRMLAEAGFADVIMAPAADMFELGVKVQVLRRGTLFGVRALRLYDLYRGYASLEALPTDVKRKLEGEILGARCEEVWDRVQEYFRVRDPSEIERARADPKHRMALVFRWYLGLSSRWAIEGDLGRRADYQIWCGPAMGAFNAWARGSHLEAPEQRSAVQIARNLLEGAAVITRAGQFRSMGVAMPAESFEFSPRLLA